MHHKYIISVSVCKKKSNKKLKLHNQKNEIIMNYSIKTENKIKEKKKEDIN